MNQFFALNDTEWVIIFNLLITLFSIADKKTALRSMYLDYFALCFLKQKTKK